MDGGDPFVSLGTEADVASGGNASVTWPGLTPGTDYEWYASLSDGEKTTIGSPWGFTTGNNLSDTTVADFNGGTVGACVVDGGIGDGAVRLNIPSSTSCVFESRVFDAGELVDWTTLSSTATLPVGTSINFEARTGNNSSPDGSWTNWQAVNGTLTNPGSQYIQYRATLSTTDSGQTPVLEDVTIAKTSGSISILNTPSGTLTTWNGAFAWTGVEGATWYLIEVQTSAGTQVFRQVVHQRADGLLGRHGLLGHGDGS